MDQTTSMAAGPALNVIVGATVAVALWRRRTPGLLPWLMLGPVALLVEGVGMVIGLVDYPDLRSDWVDVMLAGQFGKRRARGRRSCAVQAAVS